MLCTPARSLAKTFVVCTASVKLNVQQDQNSGGFLYTPGTGEPLNVEVVPKTKPESINTATVSPDGAWGVLGRYDGTILIWDLAALPSNKVLEGHKDWIVDLSFARARRLRIEVDNHFADVHALGMFIQLRTTTSPSNVRNFWNVFEQHFRLRGQFGGFIQGNAGI